MQPTASALMCSALGQMSSLAAGSVLKTLHSGSNTCRLETPGVFSIQAFSAARGPSIFQPWLQGAKLWHAIGFDRPPSPGPMRQLAIS